MLFISVDTVPEEVPEKMVPVFVEGEFETCATYKSAVLLKSAVLKVEGHSYIHCVYIDDDSEYAKISSSWKSDGRSKVEA